VQAKVHSAYVEIWHQGQCVARYECCFERQQKVLNLEHYLDALTKKPGAFAGSTALEQWRAQGRWPTSFDRFWEMLKQRRGKQSGTRAMIEADAGATAVAELPMHRPFKIIYATLYYDVRATFVVDITNQFETRLQSLIAYTSQFTDQEAGKGIFPAHAEIRARVEAMARFYGMLAGVSYAEPFLQKEVGLVEDLTVIPVKSI